jgi:methylenetetrahydrofolate reductase (NADPH)
MISHRCALADLARHISYEVMPLKSTERAVLADVPTTVPLTVTVTESRGIDTTLKVTERLLAHGYQVSPHLPARQFTSATHVHEVVQRLHMAGATSVFVVGGDAPTPAGPFPDAYSLLQAMEGHPFTEIAIGGYPEGRGAIPQQAIDLALKQKSPLATRILTQICFDATTTTSWAQSLLAAEITLPIYVGMPGPVNRQKLMRISARLGLGQSARFLSKQQGLIWRLLLPGAYQPTRLAKQLAAHRTPNIQGLHIFTFNELHQTERWRQSLLAGGEAR